MILSLRMLGDNYKCSANQSAFRLRFLQTFKKPPQSRTSRASSPGGGAHVQGKFQQTLYKTPQSAMLTAPLKGSQGFSAPNEKCAVGKINQVHFGERFFVRRILFRPTIKPLNKFEKILFTVLFAVRELYVYTAPNEKCAVGKISQI